MLEESEHKLTLCDDWNKPKRLASGVSATSSAENLINPPKCYPSDIRLLIAPFKVLGSAIIVVSPASVSVSE